MTNPNYLSLQDFSESKNGSTCLDQTSQQLVKLALWWLLHSELFHHLLVTKYEVFLSIFFIFDHSVNVLKIHKI